MASRKWKARMIHPGFRGAARVGVERMEGMLHLGNACILRPRKKWVETRAVGHQTGRMNDIQAHPHYKLVARAIVELTSGSAPTLAVLADGLGVSEFHLQRVFSEWAGVSPKPSMWRKCSPSSAIPSRPKRSSAAGFTSSTRPL